MMLYKRQKLLLDLVHAAGGELAATDLQKLLFRYARQCESEPSFQFVPYRFGCFSFQSYADRATLQQKGMILESDESLWKLTPKANPYLDPKRKAALVHFLTRIVPERGNDLVRRIYRLYPYYAIRSEILDRIFPDKNDQKAIQNARSAATGQTAPLRFSSTNSFAPEAGKTLGKTTKNGGSKSFHLRKAKGPGDTHRGHCADRVLPIHLPGNWWATRDMSKKICKKEAGHSNPPHHSSRNPAEFSDLMKPIFSQQDNLERQNQELTALRDWLLPMLMNGQVRVG